MVPLSNFISLPFIALASVLIIKVSLLFWVPLVVVGLAGPVWLTVIHVRRHLALRKLRTALEEDFVP